jgi:superfamily II DNA helicase RecQ
VAKLKTFRYEGERRLQAVANYAQSNECRSVFLRRYFGEEHPPRCGTCDRCRASQASARHLPPVREGRVRNEVAQRGRLRTAGKTRRQ